MDNNTPEINEKIVSDEENYEDNSFVRLILL